jgi:hypothetical protein
MSEAALLSLITRYPHPAAIARRVKGGNLHTGVRRLEARGLIARRGGLYRVTRRGRDELRFERNLRVIVQRAR